MNACRACGHAKLSHIYGEGPCRTGDELCSCREYVSPSPCRVRLLRTKGARLPEGTANVARPTKWGNPFRVGDDVYVTAEVGHGDTDTAPAPVRVEVTQSLAVALFEALVVQQPRLFPDVETLRGRDLACWCPPDQPCHADVLLRLANQ